MIPCGDITSDRLTFLRPNTARWPGVAAIGVGTVMAISSRFVSAVTTWATPVLLAIGVAVAVAGLVMALWDSRIDLDLKDGRYQRTEGLPPFRRTVVGSASDFQRLVLVTRQTLDPYGDEGLWHSLTLEGPRGRVTLLYGYTDAAARDIAYRIAARLGQVVEERTLAPNEPDDAGLRTRRVATGAVWTGFAGVVIVMFWPVISGARPLWQRPRQRGPSSTQPRSVMPAPIGAFSEGWDLYRQGSYQEAEVKFRQAAMARTEDPEPLNMLAYALAEQNKLDEALKTAQEALSLAPDSGNIIDTVAEMYERRGDLKLAATNYERALAFISEGEDTETHCKYARTLIGLGRKAEAKPHLIRAAQTQLHPYGRLAVQLLREHFPGNNSSGTSSSGNSSGQGL
jgi:hypothetical protein